MLYHNIASNCCKSSENLPVLPQRRFEDIPDETQFEPIPPEEPSNQEALAEETKKFIRNRLVFLGVLALFVVFFQYIN